MEFFDSLTEVVAPDDGIRQNACAAHNGFAGDFPGDLLDELALCPVDGCCGDHKCLFLSYTLRLHRTPIEVARKHVPGLLMLLVMLE